MLPHDVGMFSHSLHEPDAGCARAKLDVWFDRGRYTFAIFDPGAPGRSVTNDESGTVVILGAGPCRYRVRIERAE